MKLPLPISLLLVAALASASAAGASERRDAIAHPAGARQVVLRVESGGGFVPVQFNLRAMPSFTLYGDGTIVTPGAVIQIYPGPALTPLVRTKLSEAKVQALLRRARAAGLLARGRIDYGQPAVSDMPTTTLTVNAGGRHVVRAAYGLSADAGAGGLTAAQAAARRALARFIGALPQGAGGGRLTPHGLAVYVGPFRGQPQAGARRIVWPLKRDLATAGKRPSSGFDFRCMTVVDAAATTLLATLRKANEQSRWSMRGRPGRSYQLVVRPLLPDEPDCAALAR